MTKFKEKALAKAINHSTQMDSVAAAKSSSRNIPKTAKPVKLSASSKPIG